VFNFIYPFTSHDGWLIHPFSYMCQEGLSTSTLASSFGKVIPSKIKPEDLASTVLTAFTYNIVQVSFFFSFLPICLL
jgi:hypothetical protein